MFNTVKSLFSGKKERPHDEKKKKDEMKKKKKKTLSKVVQKKGNRADYYSKLGVKTGPRAFSDDVTVPYYVNVEKDLAEVEPFYEKSKGAFQREQYDEYPLYRNVEKGLPLDSDRTKITIKGSKMKSKEKMMKDTAVANPQEDTESNIGKNMEFWVENENTYKNVILPVTAVEESGPSIPEKKLRTNKLKYVNMDLQSKRQLYTCGENFLIQEQIPSWMDASQHIQGNNLTKDTQRLVSEEVFQPDLMLNERVALWYGDITRLEIDVIVNATSSFLMDVARGVNKAVREAAGPELDLELQAQGLIVSGSVFKTSGFKLPAKWIYHSSGPTDAWKEKQIFLERCYTNALNLLKEDKLRTIAFPCISAGGKRVPAVVSAEVALTTVRKFLSENIAYDKNLLAQVSGERFRTIGPLVDKVVFCIYDESSWDVYSKTFPLVFPPTQSPADISENPKLPVEILRMDSKSIELYKKALEEGKEKDFNIRIMVVGPYGVGKTSFTKRLLCQDVDINERNSTDGIDVHVNRCKVSLKTTKWTVDSAETVEDIAVKRLARVLGDASNTEITESTRESLGISEMTDIHDQEELISQGKTSDESIMADQYSAKPVDVSSNDFSGLDTVDGEEVNYNADTANCPSEQELAMKGHADTVNCPSEQELLMKGLKEVVAAGSSSERDDNAIVSVWDFGGQFVFYTTHQMFLSHRAIYVLISNVNEHIGSLVMDDEPYFDCSGAQSLKIEDFIDIWLTSIHGHSKSDRPGDPPVILVGTHTDKLNSMKYVDNFLTSAPNLDFLSLDMSKSGVSIALQRGSSNRPQKSEFESSDKKEEQVEAMFDAIRNRFSGKEVSLHFIDKDFGISNATQDPKMEDLRQTIIKVAAQQRYWGELKPVKWIPLERLLEDLRKKGTEIISRSVIEEQNSTLPVPISSDEELDLFLRFQHETANIMYFSLPELRDKIVLSPQFLVNALKSLITAQMFCKKKPEILDKWKEFRQKGILLPSLLDAVWKRQENQRFQENRDHIIALMEHLNIIARPIYYTEKEPSDVCSTTQQEDYYLVPCMLKESPPHSVFQSEEAFISTPCLCLSLDHIAFPSAIFNRLLVACMSLWPVAKKENKYRIYCGCGQFDIDIQHRLTLTFISNAIGLRITKYSNVNKHPSVTVCKNVFSILKRFLQRIGESLSLVLNFGEYVKCPGEKAESFECLCPVKKLEESDEVPCHNHNKVTILHSCEMLKYWFDSEEIDHNTHSMNGKTMQHSLPTHILNRVPTDRELAKVAHGIGKEFQQLALELGLTQARIDQIRDSNMLNVLDQITKILLEWRKQKGNQATFRELEKAMVAVGVDTVTAFREIQS